MNSGLILLVDDKANIVQMVSLYLEHDGYQVQPVGDGLEALKDRSRRSGGGRGAGLGLAIARQIVLAHDGQI